MGLQFSQLNVAAPSELQYFNLTSPVILPIILTLEIGAIDYTPTKIEFSDWGTIKATTPTGMLPVAKLSDGTTIVESSAIA
ncbi:hypothetical protein M885DRAFT_89358 [Pelagophyceae sp. CCMP2097]|nr:hypothetical protein M885DRAFT_89358 [Pelagophyceae sp. CCMP2097]